ncbi:twin-arginine translocase subunit TatC [Corynebacterium sp.]|uniref:twin-arginine translocase subunit TatC n=1 Tax=Corynebacterium sp. TaxID=1720 RepID=UPI0034A1987F
MTIVEHIQELRHRLILSLAGIAVGTILGFIWYQTAFTIGPYRIPFTSADFGPLHFKSLGELLKDPYCQLPPEMRLGGGEGAECRLLATSPFEMFMLRLKVGALAGLVLSSPWWLYQIWAYITPGLVRRERRMTRMVVTAAALLFVMGSVLAYFVVAYGLEFLLQIGDETQISALTGQKYFGFLLALILVFGVSFEVPLFVVMLNIAGVITYESVKDKRAIIIMSLFIFAAFMTPGQDPVSMVAMATALTLLVEIAIQFCRIHDRRKANSRPEWLDLDDEQGSGPIASSGPIAASGGIGEIGGIGAPTSVGAPTSIQPGGAPHASAAPSASQIPGPTPVNQPTQMPQQQMPQSRPTRNSRPPRPMPEVPPRPTDFRNRPPSDFDDVL